MLCTPYVQVYAEALRLCGLMVARMPLDNDAVEHVLLASRPRPAMGPLEGPSVSQLVWKGLTCDVTQPTAVQVLVSIHMLAAAPTSLL